MKIQTLLTWKTMRTIRSRPSLPVFSALTSDFKANVSRIVSPGLILATLKRTVNCMSSVLSESSSHTANSKMFW